MAKEKSGKKSSPNNLIFFDSEDSTPYFECELCGILFNEKKAFQNHLIGENHKMKMTQDTIKSKKTIHIKNEESEDEESDESIEIICKTCCMSFTSYICYAAHVKGRVHTKNTKKQELKKQLDDRPEVIRKTEEEEGDSDSENDILQKPYARCSTCAKEFSGPEAFNLHLKSATHRKKVKQETMLVNFKKENDKLSDGEESYNKCTTCNKTFTGLVPYQIHMKSKVHYKQVEKEKIAEEIKEFCENTEEGYVCKECKKSFTDPLGFKCHWLNNSHEKLKAKNAIAEFLNKNPEIVYVTPYENEEAQSDEPDSTYYLICKLCQVSFSGPESAKDHVTSKNHLTTQKEKKMKKLLKKQLDPDQKSNVNEEVSEVSSSDNIKSPNLSGEKLGFEIV